MDSHLAAVQTTLRLSDKGTDFVSALYTGLQRICLGLECRTTHSLDGRGRKA